jgi:bifunctional non-homologous end joining protein LigD
MPRDYVPQLATLVKTPPAGDEWWHEIKYDGYRIGCRVRGDAVTLISRNGKNWTANFPEIVAAVRKLRLTDTILDGEIAAVLADGRTSFQALQNVLHRSDGKATVIYFVFDLLRHEGENIEHLPLSVRQTRLRQLLGRQRNGRIRVSEHVEGRGADILKHACAAGLEGIVSKRKERPYFRGRNSDWVKTKCLLRQELAIGGFTDPEGTRAGLGALLLGYYDEGRFVFAGKVGTGFTQKSATDLRARLDRMEQPESPYDVQPPRPIARRAHWVRPELVCEVSFSEWTSDGMIRQPAFHGLREDKRARDVRRERPAALVDAPSPAPPAPHRRRKA